MKHSFIVKLWISVALCVFSAMDSALFAQDFKRPVDARRIRNERIRIPRTQADLSVAGIYAGFCGTDMSAVDALYMGSIEVLVTKNDISTKEAVRNQPDAVVGYLTVSWFDISSNRNMAQKVMVQNANIGKRITVVTSPVLIKKSVGVKAEIKLNSPGYADQDPVEENNFRTEKECVIYLH